MDENDLKLFPIKDWSNEGEEKGVMGECIRRQENENEQEMHILRAWKIK